MFFVEDIGVARVVHVSSDRIEGILCDHALEISFSSGNGRNSSSFFFFFFFFFSRNRREEVEFAIAEREYRSQISSFGWKINYP